MLKYDEVVKIGKELGFLVLDLELINKSFRTNIKPDFPTGFTKEEIEKFITRMRGDFYTSTPPIGFVVFPSHQLGGAPIDMLYLNTIFGGKLDIDLFLKEKETRKVVEIPLYLGCGLVNLEINPRHDEQNFPMQNELAKTYGETVLSPTEVCYILLMAEKMTGQKHCHQTLMRTNKVCQYNYVCAGEFDRSLKVFCHSDTTWITDTDADIANGYEGVGLGYGLVRRLDPKFVV